MTEDKKTKQPVFAGDHHRQQPQYGTFQGVATYSQSPPVGFPQPVPPQPPVVPLGPSVSPSSYNNSGYRPVSGYAVVEGIPVRQNRLPCCGLGVGWFLFIVGFLFGSVPWYAGAIVLACCHIDYREKPGYIACTIAAVLALLVVTIGVTKGVDVW